MSKKWKKLIKTLVGMTPVCLQGLLPDKLYIKFLYYYAYGEFPNLKNPRTFDEKLQWYKLNYRKPEMTMMADKYEARKYVAEKGLEYILNDLYFIKDKLEEKDFTKLPESFVIKATHGCGFNIINKEGNLSDTQEILRTASKWMKQKYFYHGREWAYKDIKPRIIAEKYLENEEFGELIDYKFYCYGGKPEVVFACAGRFSEEGVGYNAYDMDWKRIYTTKGKPGIDITFEKPVNFEEMKEVAGILSGDYPFVRVDLYSVNDKTIFGELTFYPDSGIIPFVPDEYNYFFGDLFKLPELH